MPTSYRDFLSLLVSLGPKLPAIWPQFMAWLAASKVLIEGIKGLLPAPAPSPAAPASPAPATPTAGTLSDFSVSSAEAEMETTIGYYVAGQNAAFDGTILRSAWQFFAAHPELLTLFMSLLKGG